MSVDGNSASIKTWLSELVGRLSMRLGLERMESWKGLVATFLIFGMSAAASKIYIRKKDGKIQAQKALLRKQEEMLRTYEAWMNKTRKKKTLDFFFHTNNYRTAAIYGLGRVGRQLYKELLRSDIQVLYGIDRKVKCYDGLRCYEPDEDLPEVDLIIIAVPDEAQDIAEELRKNVSCPVWSINDLLFVL